MVSTIFVFFLQWTSSTVSYKTSDWTDTLFKTCYTIFTITEFIYSVALWLKLLFPFPEYTTIL